MKKLAALMILMLVITSHLQSQALSIGANGGMSVGAPPGTFPCIIPGASSIQCSGTITGSNLFATEPVPFVPGGFSALGYGQTNNETDIYTGGGGGLQVWTPNNLSTAWLNILSLDNTGTLSPLNDIKLTAGNCYYLGGTITQSICDDSQGGIVSTTTSGATLGHTFWEGGALHWQMDSSGNLKNGAGNILLLAGATGTTGTGNVVYDTAPSLKAGAIAVTGSSCASNTNIATQAYVANCAGGGSGVTTLALTTTGSSGASTGNITGATLTLNIPQYTSASISPVTLAIPSGLAANGNTCYGWTGSAWVVRSGSNFATITMAGVVTTPTPSWTGSGLQGSAYLTTGWGAVGGLILEVWPSAANTVGWDVCNQTPSLINSGTPSFTIKASN
jgi:hypothetical protein